MGSLNGQYPLFNHRQRWADAAVAGLGSDPWEHMGASRALCNGCFLLAQKPVLKAERFFGALSDVSEHLSYLYILLRAKIHILSCCSVCREVRQKEPALAS